MKHRADYNSNSHSATTAQPNANDLA